MKRHNSKLAGLLNAALEGRSLAHLSERERRKMESLINVAQRLRELPRVEPSESARDRCLARIERETAHSAGRSSLSTRRGQFLAFVTSVVLLLLIVGGVAVATARSSLPGELLYPVKRVTEDIRLYLTKDSEGRVEWCVCLSQRRLDEFVVTAKSGEVHGKTLQAMLKATQCAQMAAEHTTNPKRDVLIAQVGQVCQAQGSVLEDIKDWIPVKDTALVNAAIVACALQCKACCICPSGNECDYDQ